MEWRSGTLDWNQSIDSSCRQRKAASFFNSSYAVMATGREFLTRVIELYRALPCLWKTTDPNYHNKAKRNAAMGHLVELFKEQYPDVTKDFVVKKITSMRGSFRKELNKVRVSKRSGKSPDEIHVPKLWYYNLMLFLEDQEVPLQSKRAYSKLDEKSDDEIVGDESETSTPASPSRETTPELSIETFKRARPKTDKVLDNVVSKIDQHLHNSTIPMPWKKQHEAFGEHIAEKLRSLPPEQRPFCQKLINDAIFYAEIGALNLSSRIVPK